MYEYIIGNLTEIHPAYIVIENNGIGYLIAVGNPYQYSDQMNQQIKVFVHQVIREDAHTLYGFNTLEEKRLFLRLISVSGIGPKSGLAIMANEDHEGLITAIESSNITFLTKFPGVGKKTAQQLILDLQGKLEEAPTTNKNTTQTQENPALNESMEALQALGYTDKEIKKVYKILQQEEPMTTDEYLRMALKVMMKK
ncbi:Holliday junction branch migration protein RuvA [Tetragenococcus koreensis]|uniref:Holliday junction branch migration complex subunit RuvA n=1 Tax=Tetragenococcus koreensis TaxID=290335 RepID=A0AAN4ZTD2_9ENTE|nr:Holliday junction branch migration protein RuvA [Tetragenococcus koreensis]MDN5831999.1 Holliday junction branch migration protein RuvA [Tetragenococcus halophilus]AYW45805.1 Holliday junction branch migration protein RuvA [Tetragenococcus koreensis]MCF1585905.1 Holliday junction branch migration protein RuvA [Tetragenococcus koreensis]MCF1615482.1 Holliday junction branch migration protein RuvA [Tetragenococcus koreensis]MCF1617588.1 Holliday junction branch migration protein RuvA [Tetrage